MKNSSKFVWILIIAMVLVVAPIRAGATVWTLTDMNSEVQVDDSNQTGMSLWKVDGMSQLATQWFWYGIGDSAEKSIDTLTLVSAVKSLDDMLTVSYTDGLNFDLKIKYILTGGIDGSRASDIAEIFSVTSKRAMDFHFFQYTDFDLSETPDDDYAYLVTPNANTISQEEVGIPGQAPMVCSETIVVTAPTYYWIEDNPIILNSLNDAYRTILPNTQNTSVGNASFAWQWDKTFTGAGSFIMSVDKNISSVPDPVPEPSTIFLFSLGFLGLGVVGIKRRNKEM